MEAFYYILILFIISIVFFTIIANKKLSPEDNEKITEAQKFLKLINESKKDYFIYSKKNDIKKRYMKLYHELSNKHYRFLRDDTIKKFIKTYSSIDALVQTWNKSFIERELSNNNDLFNNIDGKSLDMQQRRAVVVDEDNNLIVAGAGSGKTLTLSAKVKYLVDKKNINPDEILLISFTKKAAEEMEERINNKLKIDVKVNTFHKLGLNIISQFQGNRPDVFEDLSGVINRYFNEVIIEDRKAMKNLIKYFAVYFNVPKDIEKYDSLGELYEENKNVDLTTIKSKVDDGIIELKKDRKTIQDEQMKSVEEVIIANYLYLMGIKYTYEKLYPYQGDDPYRKKYRPDFYLDEYDIYLEHFGITKDYRCPHLKKIEEKKYIEGIKWKREVHKKNNTTLIETYSYYNSDGTLLKELHNLLESHGVVYNELDYTEVYKKVLSNKKDKYFSEFKKLIESFIGLFKSNGYKIDYFKTLYKTASEIENDFLKNRTKLFLAVVQPIFVEYEKELKKSEKIDFNDMINNATDIIKTGKVKYNLKYILIDEYQDISISRFKLIKELKNQTNAKIMAVGDDWQSIYRFAGSDIDLFTNFKKYFGYSEILKIEKTYRNSQELIDIAGKFIMENPKQIKKNLTSDKRCSNPIRIFGYVRKYEQAIINTIEEIVNLNGNDAEIMILGRNNFDIKILEERSMFKIITNNNFVKIKYSKYPNLRISYYTAHRSKGIEAENVIIINLQNNIVGFPSKISNDNVLSLLLTDIDDFHYAEERRLFYVAITRTKNCVYLVVPDEKPSIFISELREVNNIQYENCTEESLIQNNPNCPKCQKGYLVLRKSSITGSKFLGCSNYPLCDYELKNTEILEKQIICDKCGDYMVIRKGEKGEFYGCSNYPFCKNTISIEGNENNYFNSEMDSLVSGVRRQNYYIESHEKNDGIKNEYNKLNDVNIEESQIDQLINNTTSTIKNNLINKNDKNSIYTVKDTLIPKIEKQEADILKNRNKIENQINIIQEQSDQITDKKTLKTINNLKNKRIKHSEFGIGTIIGVDSRIVKVNFDNGDKINFSYEMFKTKGFISFIEEKNLNGISIIELKQQSDNKFNDNDFNEEALYINKTLIEKECFEIQYYLRLAECYKKGNQFEEAVLIYKEVLDIDPKNKIAIDNIEIYGKDMFYKYKDKVFDGAYSDIGRPTHEESLEWFSEEQGKINMEFEKGFKK